MRAADLVRRMRKEAGMTQAELARRAGTTQSAIARLEAEGANPRLGTLERVMSATGHRLELSLAPKPPDVDETMIAANLRLSPAQRLAAFDTAYENVRRLAASVRTGSA